MSSPTLTLGLPGWSWADLHDPARLAELSGLFMRELGELAPAVHERLAAHQAARGQEPADLVSSTLVAAVVRGGLSPPQEYVCTPAIFLIFNSLCTNS